MNLPFTSGLVIGFAAATLLCVTLAYLWFLRARKRVAALKQDIILRQHANDAYEKAMRTGKTGKVIPSTKN